MHLKKSLLNSLQSKWKSKLKPQPGDLRYKPPIVRQAPTRHILEPLLKQTDKSMFCDLCDFFTESGELFERHFRTWHSKLEPEWIYPCKYCNRRFRLEDRLTVHVNKWHPEAPEASKISCRKCYKTFLSKEFLEKHKQDNICYKFTSRSFPAHSVTSVPSKKVFCELCGKLVFNLSTHIRQVHEKRRDHLCRVRKLINFMRNLIHSLHLSQSCGKAFYSRGQVKNHEIDYHTDGGTRRHECDICGSRTYTKMIMANHMKCLHLPKEYNFHCRICLKGFRHAHQERIHMRTHPNDHDDGYRVNPETNNFHCPFCDYQHRDKQHLAWHIPKKHRYIYKKHNN